MKKAIIFILTLIITALLTACSFAPIDKTSSEPTAQPTASPTQVLTAMPTEVPTPTPTATPEPPYISTIENMSNVELIMELFNVSYDLHLNQIIMREFSNGNISEEKLYDTMDYYKDWEDAKDPYAMFLETDPEHGYSHEYVRGAIGKAVGFMFYNDYEHYKITNLVSRVFYIETAFGKSYGDSHDTRFVLNLEKTGKFDYTEGSGLFEEEWNARDKGMMRGLNLRTRDIYENGPTGLYLGAFEGRIFSKLDLTEFEIDKEGMAFVKYMIDYIQDIAYYGDYTDEEVAQMAYDNIYNNDDLLDVEKIACLSNVYNNLDAKIPGRGEKVFNDILLDGEPLLDYVFKMKLDRAQELTGDAYNEIFDQSLIDYTNRNTIPEN